MADNSFLVAGVAIDISLNQITGLTAMPVIKKYLEHFPALRPLILIVKSYLNQRGMNEVYKGGLGSYSIICLVISFLQVRLHLIFRDSFLNQKPILDAPEDTVGRN
jgi:non-canonical poly(A) RNA polymerase PAPD5/7